jgi:hypothetical protein
MPFLKCLSVCGNSFQYRPELSLNTLTHLNSIEGSGQELVGLETLNTPPNTFVCLWGTPWNVDHITY